MSNISGKQIRDDTLKGVDIDENSLKLSFIRDADNDTKIDLLEAWNDGVGNEWREHLPKMLNNKNKIGIELNHTPPLVRNYIDTIIDKNKIVNVTPIISEMRMVKSKEELEIARHAGKVAVAMMAAGKSTIADDVPEYEVAIASSNAGTRKASEILNEHYK